jgi:Domain of unknown function (DUF3883)
MLGGLLVVPAGLLTSMAGRTPFEKLGYDLESRVPGTGKLRFIEVKGRISGAETITVTRNEILYSLNKPDDFILAIVEFLDGESHRIHYLRQSFQREPDFGATSVNYELAALLAQAEEPACPGNPGAYNALAWIWATCPEVKIAGQQMGCRVDYPCLRTVRVEVCQPPRYPRRRLCRSGRFRQDA